MLLNKVSAVLIAALLALLPAVCGADPGVMQLISRNAPAFASTNSSSAGNAQDANPDSEWSSTVIPAWLAYDLSSIPSAQRQSVLVSIHALLQDYYNVPADWMNLPITYTIESNTAAGGGNPPASGWTVLATVSNNVVSTPQTLVNLNGANWIRINISQATALGVNIDMDVYSTPLGANDSWLFMGDSITAINFPYAFSDIPTLVNNINSTRWPTAIDAGLGGTAANSASLAALNNYIPYFPGRYTVFAYGTNNHPADFDMEPMILQAIADGRIPVVPHIPWSDQRLVEGPQINQLIDALYAKYPQIIPGPDLWSVFLNRTDLIPSGDVHPNAAGAEVLRQTWSTFMASINPASGTGTSPCDVNGDGTTNVSDVQLCVNQAIGISPCTTGDINKDGQCTVVDVQRVVNAALGGQCVTQ